MRARRSLPYLSLLFALAPICAASAQQGPPREVDAWALGLDFGFNGSSGNSSIAMLTAGVKVTHLRKERAEFEWETGYEYGRSQGEVVARSAATSLKFDLHPQATWSPFVFTTAERDPIRRLEVQANGGAGVKYTFWKADAGKASVSLASLYSHESFTAPAPGGKLLPSRRNARWSLRLKGERALGPAVRLSNTTFYQPVWDEGDDYDVSAVSAVNVSMGGRVSMFVRHTYRRDSTPPARVEPVDQKLAAGLSFKL